MKMLNRYIAFLFILCPVVLFAGTNDNEVKLDQAGDTLKLYIDQIGYGGSADSSVLDVDITGNSNTFDIDWAYAASAERLDFDLDITGSSNVWNIDIENDDATWNVDVIGSSNNFLTTQSDGAYNSITMEWIGSNGDIDILQSSGTCPSGVTGCYGVINADFDSENAIVDIKQKDTGD